MKAELLIRRLWSELQDKPAGHSIRINGIKYVRISNIIDHWEYHYLNTNTGEPLHFSRVAKMIIRNANNI